MLTDRHTDESQYMYSEILMKHADFHSWGTSTMTV